MALQESGEMYLETIYVLSQNSSVVRSIDVAGYMGFSKPSVSRAISLLKSEGLVKIDKDGYLKLTEAGLILSKRIYERHTVLSHLFTLLGVDEKVASEDACIAEDRFYLCVDFFRCAAEGDALKICSEFFQAFRLPLRTRVFGSFDSLRTSCI